MERRLPEICRESRQARFRRHRDRRSSPESLQPGAYCRSRPFGSRQRDRDHSRTWSLPREKPVFRRPCDPKGGAGFFRGDADQPRQARYPHHRRRPPLLLADRLFEARRQAGRQGARAGRHLEPRRFCSQSRRQSVPGSAQPFREPRAEHRRGGRRFRPGGRQAQRQGHARHVSYEHRGGQFRQGDPHRGTFARPFPHRREQSARSRQRRAALARNRDGAARNRLLWRGRHGAVREDGRPGRRRHQGLARPQRQRGRSPDGRGGAPSFGVLSIRARRRAAA